MKFQLRCESIREYDPEKQAYLKCNRVIDVDSSQVGTLVPCPACGNDVEVVNPGMLGMNSTEFDSSSATGQDPGFARDVAGAGNLSDPLTPVQRTGPKNGEQPGETAYQPDNGLMTGDILNSPFENRQGTKAPAPAFVDPVTEIVDPRNRAGRNDTPVSKDRKNSTPAQAAEKKGRMDQVLPAALTPSDFNRQNCCQKCGAQLEEKQPVCPKCQTPRQAAYVDREHRKPGNQKGPFGFQLWLFSLTTGRDDRAEGSWFVVLSIFFPLLMLATGGFLFLYGGLLGIPIGIAACFAGYTGLTAFLYWSRALKNPRTRVPVLGKVAWVILLFLCRNLRFRTYKRKAVLDRRYDEKFGDQQLADLRDIKKLRVLDLDGSGITDAGLLYLHQMRGIHFLVLNNTRLTENAVHELQQTIPKTWIWYSASPDHPNGNS
ncbi:MAG: hypothetical protein VX768_16905 [Planctomycetota bacterium]|nr:hypothetical protein [Planctomycetota bacterium]